MDMTNNHNNRHNTEGTRDHLSPLQGTVAGISVIKAGVRRPPFSVAYENIIFFILGRKVTSGGQEGKNLIFENDSKLSVLLNKKINFCLSGGR